MRVVDVAAGIEAAGKDETSWAEMTVEEALNELREIAATEDDIELRLSWDSDNHRCFWFDLNQAPLTNADTLPELMVKVRKWKEENNG